MKASRRGLVHSTRTAFAVTNYRPTSNPAVTVNEDAQSMGAAALRNIRMKMDHAFRMAVQFSWLLGSRSKASCFLSTVYLAIFVKLSLPVE